MGKPGRWLKSVLLGKKPSKSTPSKDTNNNNNQRIVNGNEVVVISKVEESDVVSDLRSFGSPSVYTSGVVETENTEHESDLDDEIHQLTEVQPSNSVHDESLLSETEKTQQEIAATVLQAAFRSYLARRAFYALKGIIRLQALIRGHMVRRQAVSTLFSVMGIVRLQSLARGRQVRHSNIGVEVLTQHNQTSVVDTNAYLGIKKLTANAFAQKLLASSPSVMPLHLDNDASNAMWLEKWSASCFWKPVPQPKKASVKRIQKKFASNHIVEGPKKSVRKVSTSNLDNPSFESEKSKRSFRKVSTVEPPPAEDLEKVKRGLRKVHNPVVDNSIQQPQPVLEKETEKPNPVLEEPMNVIEEVVTETVMEQPEEVLGTNEAIVVIEESEESVKEERTTPKQNSVGKENQKSVMKKNSSVITTQTVECQETINGSPGIPSYMQATKSAKAKLRLQGSSSPKQQQETVEKATRRYSLPSSGNNARVTSHSPKTTRLSNSGGKTGKKTLSSREGNGKTTPVEWKR